MLRLRAFGGLSIHGAEGPLEGAAAQRRRLAVLAPLAVAGERGVSRDRLLALLWPESEPEKARHGLAQALYALRRATGQEELVLGTTELRLNPQAMTSDVGEFEGALAAGDLERACTLYGGPFLDGFHLADAPEFERWTDEQRARLGRLYARALESAAERLAARGEHREAAERWRTRAALDPTDARVAVGLMRALAAAGDRPGALQHARVYEALVQAEFETPPDPAVMAVVRELKEARDVPLREPALAALAPHPTVAGSVSASATYASPASKGPTPPTPPVVPATPAERQASAERITVGTVVGDRYEVMEELGRGATACVFAARDRRHDRAVALKVLRPEIAATIGRDRFLREIRIAARLTHPHILPLFDSGDWAGCLYYVMPKAEGRTLRALLDEGGPLPVEHALRIGRQLADALSHAHVAGVVHRDVKPGNVVLSGGHAVLTDFGMAKAVSVGSASGTTDAGLVLGTPEYMSPEQVGGDAPVDGRSDVYALGCVLHEMLTGTPPVTGPDIPSVLARKLTQPVRSVRATRPSVPVELDSLLARMLDREPGRRPRSVEVRDALRRLEDRRSAARRILLRLPATPRARASVAAVGLAVVVAAGLAMHEVAGRGGDLDPDLIAVAPFEVLDPELSLWREGLMDVLARNLDGAGPLRTVSPTVVVRRWEGRADLESATLLGARTKARLAVYGQLVRTGGDSVRLLASLVDVRTRRPIADLDIRAAGDRMDHLADSATMRVLRELGRARRIAVAPNSIASIPLPALKDFLRGEQLYRGNRFAEAAAMYERAVTEHGSFAMAHRRMRSVLRGLRGEQDSLSFVHALRAGALNHGLSPRDSLLVTADSLYAALGAHVPGGPRWWSVLRRHFATLDDAVARYPDDPEAWLEVGESRYHFGERIGLGESAALAAFETALAIDSLFAPAYYHAIELSATVRGTARARRLLAAYTSLNPTDEGFVLAARLVDEPASAFEATIAGLPTPTLERTAALMRRWPDANETAIRLYRHLADSERAARARGAPGICGWLCASLSYRGHSREAIALADSTTRELFASDVVQLALEGSLPRSDAERLFTTWTTGSDPRLAIRSLAWWTARRDTATLRFVAGRLGDLAAADPEAPLWKYGAAAAHAHLSLARADTAAALRQFEALPDSVCSWMCIEDRLTLARLQVAAHRDADAAATLDRRPPTPGALTRTEVAWRLERARVAARLGDHDLATRLHSFVADVWRNGDPEVQGWVREARDALDRSR